MWCVALTLLQLTPLALIDRIAALVRPVDWCQNMASHNLKGPTMRAIAVYEAKNRFSEIIAAVEHGEEITITRHGAPVARLVAIGMTEPPAAEQRQRVLGAMQQLQVLGAGSELGCTLQQAIQTGRD